MKSIRRTLATVAVAGIAGITLTAISSPANAVSGGGCASSGGVQACVSVNSIRNVVADGYLNTVPSGCARTSVSVRSNGNTVNSIGADCSKGWIAATSTPYYSGNKYTSMVRVFNSSGTIIKQVISPIQY